MAQMGLAMYDAWKAYDDKAKKSVKRSSLQIVRLRHSPIGLPWNAGFCRRAWRERHWTRRCDDGEHGVCEPVRCCSRM